MTAALTRKQAENAGYTVDAHTYPWFGYMGPRFAPTRTVEVMTEREEELLAQLAEAIAKQRITQQRIVVVVPNLEEGIAYRVVRTHDEFTCEKLP